MGKLQSIVFDLGGVFITLDQPQAVRRFKEIGLQDAEQRLDPYVQRGFFGDLEEGKISAEDFRRELSTVSGKEMTMEQCEYAWRGYVKEVPLHNLQFVLRLREEGRRVVLLSNTNPFMMKWAMSEDFSGDGHGLSYYFDKMYLSYKEGVMKPDKRIFLNMLNGENASPDEVLFIDDGLKNIEVARSLGIHTYCPKNGEEWTEAVSLVINELS